MSFLSALFGGGSTGATASALVIDGASVAGGRKLSPRDQLDLLRKFGKFAQQENLAVSLVFDSEPLRKVGDGDDFEGAKVHFTDGSKSFAKDVIKIAQKQGSNVAIVSSGGELEELAKGGGFSILRGSTMVKAIDGTSPRSGGNNRRRQGGGGGRPNNRRNNNGPRSEERTNNPPPPREKKESGGVEDLLDMVD